MKPWHPGELLREELNGESGITVDTALRLGRYFDISPEFWLDLQQAWQMGKA